MIDERELREMLHRRVRTISATPTDAPKAVRRAHRRLLRNAAVGTLVGLAALVGAFAGVRTIEAAPTPADRPKPSITPNAMSPVQRRDGEALVYNGGEASDGTPLDAANAIVAADPGTGETRVLVDAEELGGSLDSAAWSADGRWVAFEFRACASDARKGGIWVTDGMGDARQVMSRPCISPRDAGGAPLWAWSPTSARLVVLGYSAENRPSLVVYDATTGGRTDLDSPSGVDDISGLTWSPDGTKVVYSVSQLGTKFYAVNIDDGSTSLLAESDGVIDRDYQVRPPGASPSGWLSWSPDGLHLLFVAAPTMDTMNASLYVMNADGSGLRKLVETYHRDADFAWSPDGTTVAYPTYGEEPGLYPFQIWTVSLEDPTPVLVYESPNASSNSPVWSPDGRSIAYRIGFNDAWGATYLAVNADGSGDERPIDAMLYHSWRGGWYHCECYG
jgi:Tol biopolymer transport system component